MTTFWAIFLPAYLAGSVNFSILFLKLAGKEDPREAFSGNAGVVNVYRTAGKGWAALILASDLARSMFIAWIALHFLDWSQAVWIALALILGNSFPCFHKFRGGKGVAAYLGFSLVFSPWIGLVSAPLWVIVYKWVRISFVASFAMLFLLAAGMMFSGGWQSSALLPTLLTVALIVFNHRKNIARKWPIP